MRAVRFAVGAIVCLASLSCSAAQGTATGGAAPATSSDPADACAMFSDSDLAATVGTPVAKGRPFAGPEVCKWEAEPGNTSVLLTVRPAGSDREKVLCAELPKSHDGQRIEGLADVATWKFSNTMGLFNSGELETCSRAGYVSVSLDGKSDEAKLKQASETIVRKVLQTR
jgi:hypothetical protein